MKTAALVLLLQAIAIVVIVWLFVVFYVVAFTPDVKAADPTSRPTPCVRGANVVPTPPPCAGLPTPRPTPMVVGLPLPDTDTLP